LYKPVNKGRKSFLSLSYLFASFFGALLIASFYAYYNVKFQEFKFVSFDKIKLYGNSTIFKPIDDTYILYLYNSNSKKHKDILQNITNKEYKILAIDLHQQLFKDNNNIIYLTSGTNTLLELIQSFNIYEMPAYFLIKKTTKQRYKQNSKIKILTKGI
jgi:hypothetical protein